MSAPSRTRLAAALVPLLLLAPTAGLAAGSDTGASTVPAAQTGYAEAKAAVDAGRYPEALKLLAVVLKAEPRNADALNLMGYANRKMKRMAEAARWYDAALKANPKHLGALEYQGEMFVEMGDYARARNNLNRLATLCGTCNEYHDLRAALMAAGQG
ncbi:MAG: tetratricopeptide repeat protein [Albidovulum sp.]